MDNADWWSEEEEEFELEQDEDYHPLDFDNKSKFDRAEETTFEQHLEDILDELEEEEERTNISLDEVDEAELGIVEDVVDV